MYLYYSNIPRLAAQREIRLRNVQGDLTEEHAYKLTLIATENEALASQAQSNVAYARMRQEAGS